MKKALILGVGGQDGSYLAELLISCGYVVHGMARHSSHNNLQRIKHLMDAECFDCFHLHYGDMLDPLSVDRLIRDVNPDEIYNEADQDNIDFSFKTPAYTSDITCGAVARLLESIRNFNPEIKLFQPVSATMFGMSPAHQNEESKFQPQSPYACAKVAAYYLCQHYRREYGMFVATGIMYNHDSPRRSGKYLLHKIAEQAVRVSRGEANKLVIPVADMKVDIGYARAYMQAAYKMLQHDKPDDFVIATGQGISIRQLAWSALEVAGVPDGLWDGLVQVDHSLQRVGKQPTLIGNPIKAQTELRWVPTHTAMSMVELLVEHAQDTLEKKCE